ncbi:MAG: MgtC/SapB family protein [Bacilli bacterium]|nr:MgtC/SapB family protein [Bacilli bacterium]
MVTIDQIIAEKIASWYIGEWPVGNLALCLIALFLSTILCGAVGMERESRGRTAGLRTHLLVGMGSCIIMIISIYGFPKIVYGEQVLNRDIARLAAQVIAGVGFLGAGAIIHRNSSTKGLTTAVTIWIVMTIGLACGSMNFILATGGTILILLVLISFRKIETRIAQKNPMINMVVKKGSAILSSVLEIADRHNVTVQEFNSTLDEEGNMSIFFVARISNDPSKTILGFVADLEKVDGVVSVSAMNGVGK